MITPFEATIIEDAIEDMLMAVQLLGQEKTPADERQYSLAEFNGAKNVLAEMFNINIAPYKE